MQTSKIRFNADRKERDISVDHLYKWALRGEDVGIKCSTALTGGKEKYHGTKRDMIQHHHKYFLYDQREIPSRGIWRWANFCFCKNK